MSGIEVNGRRYRYPREPVVVVCVDGSEPGYHQQAVAAGRMPFLESVLRRCTDLTGECAMPSFTNPNNLSIATGVPPAVHGICGNYYFDRDRGEEVMMNDPAFLRAPTIFAAFERAGVDAVVITAKDKLRRLLGSGLTAGPCFSAEKADAGVLDLVGLPLPSPYSADLSEFVLAAGVRLLETCRPGLMYLSLTDYVQHKFAPDAQEALEFYEMLDAYFARLDALGAVLVVTADHGMNAKPGVVYLQQQLDDWLGAGRSHVVLPITDPYTVHHASLGSFAFVHLDGRADRPAVAAWLRTVGGVAEVVADGEVSERFELPPDRVGDIAVVARQDVALGTAPDRHDRSQLDRPLRSHGGLTEQRVPVIVNRELGPLPDGHQVRNFDAYWLGLNFAAATEGVTDHRSQQLRSRA